LEGLLMFSLLTLSVAATRLAFPGPDVLPEAPRVAAARVKRGSLLTWITTRV